jgi:hypothetical protein
VNDSRFTKVYYRKDKVEFEDVYNKALEYICLIDNSTYGTPNFLREYERYSSSLFEEGGKIKYLM